MRGLRRIPMKYKTKDLKEGFEEKMLSLLAKLSKRWIKLNKEGTTNHLPYFIFKDKKMFICFPKFLTIDY
jgi:hypothetical protein